MNKSWIQKFALLYGVIFLLVVLFNYIPSIHDDSGKMFGLFKLDLIDDVLHLGSALWALTAGWYSFGAAKIYFKCFGALYLLDGIIGLIIGKGLLDFGIFLPGEAATGLLNKFMLNVPHLVLGGGAVLAGFVLSKYYVFNSTSAKRSATRA